MAQRGYNRHPGSTRTVVNILQLHVDVLAGERAHDWLAGADIIGFGQRCFPLPSRKVDVRLPGKGDSNSIARGWST